MNSKSAIVLLKNEKILSTHDIEVGSIGQSLGSDPNPNPVQDPKHRRLRNAICISSVFFILISFIIIGIYLFILSNPSSSSSSYSNVKTSKFLASDDGNSDNSSISDWASCNADQDAICASSSFVCCIGILDYDSTFPIASKSTCRPPTDCYRNSTISDYQDCSALSDQCASVGFSCCAGANSTDSLMTCRPISECKIDNSSDTLTGQNSNPSNIVSTIDQVSTLTYYDPSTGGGKCDGVVHKSSDLVVALSTSLLQKLNCFTSLSISNSATGRSVIVQVVDECNEADGCTNNNIDATVSVWSALGLDLRAGRVAVDWRII